MGHKAWFVDRPGGEFQARDVPRSTLAADHVLVRISASGVNPLDTKIRAGQAAHARQPLPAVLGLDMAGTIEEVGGNVTAFKSGDEVFGMVGGVGGLQGTLAEMIAVDANLLAHKPKSLSMREAAALPLSTITAWEGLVDRANVGAGHKVLIHAGAGGVGHIAVQIARAFRGGGLRNRLTGQEERRERNLAQLRSTIDPYRSKNMWQPAPQVKASTSSMTPSEARLSIPLSPRSSAIPATYSAAWDGVRTPWLRCLSAELLTPESSHCCRSSQARDGHTTARYSLKPPNSSKRAS